MNLAPCLLAAALALVSLEDVFADCPLDPAYTVRRGDFAYSVATIPPHVSVGEHFTLELLICRNGAPLAHDVGVDAIMPAHRHGMNYAPTVTRVGAGKFRVTGMLLHMPGHWQFVIDPRTGDRAPLVHDFNL